jgi:hypothetical protein
LGTKDNVERVKVNYTLESIIIDQLIELLKEFKDVYCLDIQRPEVYSTKDYLTPNWTKYHSTTCSSSKVQLNPNYATIVKQNIKKLLIAGFIEPVEEAIKLSPIVVVPKEKWGVEDLCWF